jgi:hypothetical protein
MTTTAFQQIKKDALSGKALKEQRAIIEREMPGYSVQKQGRIIKSRLFDALRAAGEIEGISLADKIESCGRGQLCGSVYCVECRGRAAAELNKRISAHNEIKFGDDADEARNHLRYMTVLCEITAFNVVDVKQAVADARKDIKAMKRRFGDIWVQGSFEFELIDMRLLDKSDAGVNQNSRSLKQQTLAAMMNMSIKESRSLGQRVIVHFHTLVDLNGTDEVEFNKWVRNRWNSHSNQTEVKRTNKGQTLKNMAKKISDYGFKNRVQYNLSFETNGYKRGIWFNNNHLGTLAGIYDRMDGRGYKGLLIGHG